ncbi:MAG: type II secretion system protein [Holophagae bacterium]|jgi:prepilin-type N-terminal cleavage/methylation domain-containing protein
MGSSAQIRSAEEGFTLVEILVALLILGFVALGIAGLFSHSIVTNASGHDYALLASQARFALEALQALPFDHAQLVDTAGTPASWPPVPVDAGFTITYTVEDFRVDNWTEAAGTWDAVASAADANLKRITMTVSSTNQILQGRRVFTVTSLKIPG